MARIKQVKVKEPVRIRYKKLSNGSLSIYLDIYKDGVRNYEFLSLYLVPERTPLDKNNNAEALAAANAIKSQRIIDIANGRAGLTMKTSKSKISFLDYMQVFYERKKEEQVSPARLSFINCAIVHLKLYIAKAKLKGIRIGDVNMDFCEGFENYLRTAKDTRYKEPTQEELEKGKQPVYISEGTAYSYFAVLQLAFSWAVKHDYLGANPIDKMEVSLKHKTDEKEFLTIDEVRLLAKTDCPNAETKRAFMFSCFSGFRISDIMALKWGDLKDDGVSLSASIIMKKTKKKIDQPIDKAAFCWLPERGDAKDSDKVFRLTQLSAIENHLHAWTKNAEISKHVTFHTARHTYATMLITKGSDLYVVSQMLGHSDTRMTQIYAKVLDSKKKEAASLLGDILDETTDE